MKAKRKSQKAKSKYIKVAINADYGGFGLSPKAIEKLAEKKGKKCYFFESACVNEKITYKKVDGYPTGLFWIASSTLDMDNFDYGKHNLAQRPEDRTDPDLIEVIEELGEEANGNFADLKIVKIPSNIKWQIMEYDGDEWIAEKHRTWC
jgi:hypothetical protein